VVGLVIAALWVAAALETRHLLAELAVVVGLASGLILRGAARRGGVGPAISAFVIALVAVAFGLSLAALAVYTTSNGSSLQSALEHLDGALLSNIWKDIGETGAILGGAGVIIAALIALIQRPASRS
jgi:ABC-type Fe3+-siderophore transport system permease subunit